MTKKGRPPFKATAKLRKQVEQLKAVGESDNAVARAIGCDPDTLRKHFEEELATGAVKRRKEVVDLLFAQARKGNVSATKRLEEMTRDTVAAEEFENHGRADPTADPAPAPAPKSHRLGKKEAADQDALEAGRGSEWGDDLHPKAATSH